MLAGVGASWYQWIEQGRAKNVSREVLQAISRVLQLDSVQHRYVMNLAGLSESASAAPDYDDTLLAQIAHGYDPNPAYVLDRHWNVRCANDAAVRLLGPGLVGGNYLRLLFTDPRVQDRFVDWRRGAAQAIARFQGHVAAFIDDPEVQCLAGELRQVSEDFAQMWDLQSVSERSCAMDLRFEGSAQQLRQMVLTCASGIGLVLLTPVGTPALDQSSPVRRAPSVRPHAGRVAGARAAGVTARRPVMQPGRTMSPTA